MSRSTGINLFTQSELQSVSFEVHGHQLFLREKNPKSFNSFPSAIWTSAIDICFLDYHHGSFVILDFGNTKGKPQVMWRRRVIKCLSFEYGIVHKSPVQTIYFYVISNV